MNGANRNYSCLPLQSICPCFSTIHEGNYFENHNLLAIMPQRHLHLHLSQMLGPLADLKCFPCGFLGFRSQKTCKHRANVFRVFTAIYTTLAENPYLAGLNFLLNVKKQITKQTTEIFVQFKLHTKNQLTDSIRRYINMDDIDTHLDI